MAKKPQVAEIGDYDEDDDLVGAHTSDGVPRSNTSDGEDLMDTTYRVTSAELRSFVERFERLEVEKKDIAEHQKEVMAEAKSRGYDTKILRKIIALRKLDPQVISEEEAVLEMYKDALGM